MKFFLLHLKFYLLKYFYGIQPNPCPDCGYLPEISLHHDKLDIRCKYGCHGVSATFDGSISLWFELVWQWNNLVEAYRLHSTKIHDKEEMPGFGQYFIEHPDCEANPNEISAE